MLALGGSVRPQESSSCALIPAASARSVFAAPYVTVHGCSSSRRPASPIERLLRRSLTKSGFERIAQRSSTPEAGGRPVGTRLDQAAGSALRRRRKVKLCAGAGVWAGHAVGVLAGDMTVPGPRSGAVSGSPAAPARVNRDTARRVVPLFRPYRAQVAAVVGRTARPSPRAPSSRSPRCRPACTSRSGSCCRSR
jgi:hypothetical protein